MSEVYVCRCCGGNVISSGERTGVCAYCGTKIVFPKIEFSRMNRANELRRRREYDQAEIIYQNLITTCPDDPEIWWNILLCEYGIEYVEEANRRVITVNRMKYESVFDQESYKKAIEFADEQTREIYRSEGATIENIQIQLQELASKEEKYDIFISFKDKEIGTETRTMDSVLAQEIYDALTNEGYRVFFSRITLRTTVGREYEPKIFSALQSASLMIVVAFSPEHINADWVKNEWSRYLKLMEKDAGKFLLPVYSEMKPEDLPPKLAALEGIEVNGANYINLILSNVNRLIGKDRDKRVETEVQENIIAIEQNEINFLISCGFTAIRNHKWENAAKYFENALDINVDSAMAWWGKLTILTEDFSVKGDFMQNAECRHYYDQAMRCASEDEKQRIQLDIERDKATQTAFLCEEYVQKLLSVTNGFNSLYYDESEESKQMFQQAQELEAQILTLAAGERKTELTRQIKSYNERHNMATELFLRYNEENEINNNLAEKIKSELDTLNKMEKNLEDARQFYHFGCLGFIFLIAFPPLALIRILYVNHSRKTHLNGYSIRKYQVRIKEKKDKLNIYFQEGQDRINQLTKIYDEFATKYKKVYSVVIPMNQFELLKMWSEKLLPKDHTN